MKSIGQNTSTGSSENTGINKGMIMFDGVYLLLALLFVKHWYIDFVNQSPAELEGKGTYGNLRGLMHAVKHGVVTGLIVSLFVYNFEVAVIIGFVDFVLHYHIDWLKSRINRRYNYTVDNPKFWAWFGADQLAHSLTYVFLVWILV
jgi:hypothetical protein